MIREGRGPKIVCLMGLDGAGKSTIASKLAEWLADRSVRTVRLHTHDYSAKAIARSVNSFAKERWIRQFRFLLIPWPLIALADHLLAFKRQFANQDEDAVILTDRYFYDKYVRFRFWGIVLPGVFYLYKWLMPRPRCAILLDVPVSVAIARKGEYSREEYERFRLEYLRLAHRMNGIVSIIDATAPVEEVVSRSKEIIVRALGWADARGSLEKEAVSDRPV